VKKQFDAARCWQATRDEAVAIVKKAVATIKSEGPETPKSTIPKVRSRTGTTETGRFPQALFNSASAVQIEGVY
jgi:hypothetical protein